MSLQSVKQEHLNNKTDRTFDLSEVSDDVKAEMPLGATNSLMSGNLLHLCKGTLAFLWLMVRDIYAPFRCPSTSGSSPITGRPKRCTADRASPANLVRAFHLVT